MIVASHIEEIKTGEKMEEIAKIGLRTMGKEKTFDHVSDAKEEGIQVWRAT